MSEMEELDAFLEKHGISSTVSTTRKRALKAVRKEAVEKSQFRCSCGLETSDLGVVKGHAWMGHLFHRVNQKPWSES